jgi:CheY-like chemotaxis protein
MAAVASPPSRRVLLVEDNRDSRETLHILLTLWGYDVEVAADGQAGLDKALAWEPEVAIIDIGLPLLSGYEVARRVRAALHDKTYLIALTGYCQPDDRRQALESGFDAHIPKPADFDLLSELLKPKN